MKKIKLLLIVPLLIIFGTAAAQTDQDQRIQASYILAFGKKASSGEVNYWKTQGDLTVGQMLTRHQQYLTQDAATHTAAIRRSYWDAFGRSAEPGEVQYWMRVNDTYTTLMKNHLNFLNGNRSEYEKTIRASYSNVFGRQPSADEISYWQSQAKVPFLILVAYHQDYKRRNAAIVQGRINFRNVTAATTQTLNRRITSEAAAAAGLPASGALIPGGASLIGQDGNSIIGNDAGSLIGNDAGILVPVGTNN